jgi:hypothetical protein
MIDVIAFEVVLDLIEQGNVNFTPHVDLLRAIASAAWFEWQHWVSEPV